MPIRDILALIAVAAIWGLNFVIIKMGLADFPPLFFSALRFGVVSLAVFFVPRPKIAFRYVILVGLSLGVAKFTLLFWGMNAGVGAGISSIVLQSQVFFTIVLYLFVFRERPRIEQIVGLAIGVIGLALVFLEVGRSVSEAGFLLILAAGFAWSVANLLMRKAGNTDPFALIIWMSAIAVGPLLAGSLLVEGPDAITGALRNLRPQGLFAIAYISILATLFGYAVWGKMLARYPASAVTPFALLVPIAGMFGGVVFLGESISLTSQLGAALIIAGLVVGTAGQRAVALVKGTAR